MSSFKGNPIPVESIVNAREYGGYKTNLGTMAPKRILRGAELYGMSEQDQATLVEDFQMTQVIDLRMTSEVSEHPDPEIAGVKNLHLNVIGDASPLSANPADMAEEMSSGKHDPSYYMDTLYQDFVTSEHCRNSYTTFFRAFLENEQGATYFHCTAGKDRTGFGGALILAALEAEKPLIMTDYLLSNEYRKNYNKQVMKEMQNRGIGADDIEKMRVALEVQPEYLQASESAIMKNYGSIADFFHTGLGLSKTDLADFRQLYLI